MGLQAVAAFDALVSLGSLVLGLLLALLLALVAPAGTLPSRLLRWLRAALRRRRMAARFPGPPAWPLLGNVRQLLAARNNEYVFLQQVGKRYHPTFCVWLGPMPHFFVQDPRDVEMVLGSGSHCRSPVLFEMFKIFFGEGLLTASGEKWRAQRKLIQPAFHAKVLEQFVPVFARQTAELLQQLAAHAGGAAVDVAPLASLLALDIVGETTMGTQLYAQRGGSAEYREALDRAQSILVERFMKPWLHPSWAFHLSAGSREVCERMQLVRDFGNKVLQDRKKRFAAEQEAWEAEGAEGRGDAPAGRKRMAFLDHILTAVQNGAVLTEKYILDEVTTFMAAGHDTSAYSLAAAMYLLAENQDVQERALQEIEAQFGTERLPEPDARSLERLEYLERVVKETLRFFPPAFMLTRDASSDIRLASSDLVIPEGCSVSVLPVLNAMDPRQFPEPTKFDPERWLPQNSVGRHAFSYFPFGAGQRICIGKRFSMMELKCILALLLWRFQLLPQPGYKPKIACRIINTFQNGCWLRVVARSRPQPDSQ